MARNIKTDGQSAGARKNVYDVAVLAGVDISTVSRAFSRPDLISEATREKVFAAARSLNYRPNALAGALTTKRTLLMGLVTEDIQNPYVAALARGVQDRMMAERYLSIICSTDADPVREIEILQEMVFRGVDGFIITPSQGFLDPFVKTFLRALPAQGVPVVFVGKLDDAPECDFVTANAEAGAVTAIDYLVALGHQRIAFIGGYFSKGIAVGRWRGYCEALARAGIPLDAKLVAETETSREGGFEAMARLLAVKDRPTAVFTINDLAAIGAMEACRTAGLDVPADISLIGFDDIPVASLTVPALTTVAQPAYALGRVAADLLLERVDNRALPPQQRNLSCQLIVRSSTAPREASEDRAIGQ